MTTASVDYVAEYENSDMLGKWQNEAPEGSDDASGVDDEEKILSIYMDYLTPAMKHELKHKLKETEESRENGLKALKELIEKEKSLKCRMDENFLLQFLRCRKYDVKKAFKLIQSYYAFKKEFDTIFENAVGNTVKLQELILRNFLGYLTSRDRNGSVVLIFKLGMWDPEIDPYHNIFAALSSVFAYAIENPATQIAGYRAIIDLRGMTWKQMKYCTPENAYLLVKSTQFCFPGRYKGIHIITQSKFFSILWSIVYPFLTNKLRKRVHLHKDDLTPLQKFIHPSVLPVEFGGCHPSFDNSSWKEIIKKQEVIQKEYLLYGYNK